MTQNGEQDVGPDDSKIKNDSKTNTFRRVVRAVLAILVVGGTIGIVGAIALGAGDGQDGIGDALKFTMSPKPLSWWMPYLLSRASEACLASVLFRRRETEGMIWWLGNTFEGCHRQLLQAGRIVLGIAGARQVRDSAAITGG